VKVVPITDPPRLEIHLNTNNWPLLTIYGRPGFTYLVQYTTSLLNPSWTTMTRLTLTNSPTSMLTTIPLGGSAFYRLAPVDPPQLDVSVNPDTSRKYTVYGVPGGTYVVQYTTSLGGNWLTLNSITLSNATSAEFQAPPVNGGTAFYRIVKLDLSIAPFWLSAGILSNGSRTLALHGTPGKSYALEYSTSLGVSNTWTRLPNRIAVTNSPMGITGLPFLDNVYYRAVLAFADPPELKVTMNPDGTQQMTLYGLPNSSYSIQYSTSLGGSWSEMRQVSFLENSFVSMSITSPAPGTVFYRAQKL